MVTSQLSGDGRQLTIDVKGRFDFRLYDAFRETYVNTQGPVDRYVVDLGDAEYMDSSALGMLLLLREHAGGEAADIQLVGSREQVRSVLDIANFDRLFSIG